MAVALPVAFSWWGVWKVDAIVVEVLDTGKGESQQSTGGEEEEGEVVAFLEAKGLINSANPSAEGVRGLWGWGGRRHLVVEASAEQVEGEADSSSKITP